MILIQSARTLYMCLCACFFSPGKTQPNYFNPHTVWLKTQFYLLLPVELKIMLRQWAWKMRTKKRRTFGAKPKAKKNWSTFLHSLFLYANFTFQQAFSRNKKNPTKATEAKETKSQWKQTRTKSGRWAKANKGRMFESILLFCNYTSNVFRIVAHLSSRYFALSTGHINKLSNYILCSSFWESSLFLF